MTNLRKTTRVHAAKPHCFVPVGQLDAHLLHDLKVHQRRSCQEPLFQQGSMKPLARRRLSKTQQACNSGVEREEHPGVTITQRPAPLNHLSSSRKATSLPTEVPCSTTVQIS